MSKKKFDFISGNLHSENKKNITEKVLELYKKNLKATKHPRCHECQLEAMGWALEEIGINAEANEDWVENLLSD